MKTQKFFLFFQYFYPFVSYWVSVTLEVPQTCYAGESVVVYSGRAERLIKPVLDHFEQTTGTTVELLTAGSTELVNRLRAEKARTPADVFITNEAGALELARSLDLLQPIITSHCAYTPFLPHFALPITVGLDSLDVYGWLFTTLTWWTLRR